MYVCMYICMCICMYIHHTLISMGSLVAHAYRHVVHLVALTLTNASAVWMNPDGTCLELSIFSATPCSRNHLQHCRQTNGWDDIASFQTSPISLFFDLCSHGSGTEVTSMTKLKPNQRTKNEGSLEPKLIQTARTGKAWEQGQTRNTRKGRWETDFGKCELKWKHSIWVYLQTKTIERCNPVTAIVITTDILQAK